MVSQVGCAWREKRLIRFFPFHAYDLHVNKCLEGIKFAVTLYAYLTFNVKQYIKVLKFYCLIFFLCFKFSPLNPRFFIYYASNYLRFDICFVELLNKPEFISY